MSLDLHPHNQRILAELEDTLEREGRCAVEMATGCGKSFVVYGYHERHPNERTLIVVPHAYIASDQWRKIRAIEPSYDLSNVFSMTYAMLHRRAESDDIPTGFDCIVLDELHHVGAKKWGEAVRQLIEANPTARLIGTTATPVRSDGRNPMDHLFGDAHTTPYTLIQAWLDDVLPRPTYVVGAYDITDRFVKVGNEIKTVREARARGELEALYAKLKRHIADGASNVDTLIANHITALTPHPKVIVFCPSIKALKKTEKRIGEWFRTNPRKMHISSVHSGFTPEHNENVLRKFSEDNADCIRVLLSVNCVGEGVHISGVDAVIMCRQTTSTQVYIQQMGRCLESGGAKAPVVLDLVDNLHEVGRPEFIRQYVKRTVMELARAGEFHALIVVGVHEGKTEDEIIRDVTDRVVNSVGKNPTLASIINAAATIPGAPANPVTGGPGPRGSGYRRHKKPEPSPIFKIIDTTVSTRELIDRIEDALEKNRLAEQAIRTLTLDYLEYVRAGRAPKPVDEWLDEVLDDYCADIAYERRMAS